MADPERFDADRDPTFMLMLFRILIYFIGKRNFLKIFNKFFQNLTKLVMWNFPRVRDKGEGVRDEGSRGER